MARDGKVHEVALRMGLRPPQAESLEILAAVAGVLPWQRGGDLAETLTKVKALCASVEDFERAFPSLTFALATGVGKTRLMGAFIAYLHAARGVRNFFVLAPGLTVYEKLKRDFTPSDPKYVLAGLGTFAQRPPVVITGENYVNQRVIRPVAGQRQMQIDLGDEVHINLFNIGKINAETRTDPKTGKARDPKLRQANELFGEDLSYFDYLKSLPDLVLIMDESHRYRATRGMTVLNELNPLLGLELTATPFVEGAKGKETFKNIAYAYPLSQAITDGFVKKPVGLTRLNFKAENYTEAELHSHDKKIPTKVKYQYDPHLDPQLVWASKAERSELEVETVSLHRHEVVRPQDIVSLVQGAPSQLGLFGDPRLPIHKAVEFYRHDQLWMNRLVLGDSLLVMNSLLHKENLGGQVQMIYIDPPYGIAYNSNFQPRVDSKESKDGKDEYLSREPEQIKAYRDTWTLGIHSYLSYLRDRLLLARELLTETGSVFVQISEQNVHHVRELLDEVFGATNFLSLISYKTSGGQTDQYLSRDGDYLLWYARYRERTKFRQLYRPRESNDAGADRYGRALAPDGKSSRRLTEEEAEGKVALPRGWHRYRLTSLTSQGYRENTSIPWTWNDQLFDPGRTLNWKTTIEGLERLAAAGRIEREGRMPAYRRFLDDFKFVKLTNTWTDTQTNFGGDKLYVVRTPEKVIQRCMLMTTDPGDIVLDPTCGSGSTAFVAEHWGRRWITCDTSRIAISIARQRLMAATFPFYEIAFSKEGVAGGFKYNEVPHVTLKSIAQNLEPEVEKLFDQPLEHKHVTRVSGPFTVEAIAALDPAEAMTPSPSVTDTVPARPADRVQQLFDVLAKDGGLNVPGKGRIEIEGLRRMTDTDGLDAEGEITVGDKKLRLAVAFGPYHGPVTASRLEEALQAATGTYQALAVAGFSFDPEMSAFVDKHPVLGVKLFRVQIAPDVQIGDLLKVKHAEKLFAVLGQPDFEVARQDKQHVVTLKGVDLYDPNQRVVKAHQLDGVAAWFLDTDYDGRCFRVRQVFLPAEKGKGFEKLQKALKAIVDEDAWDALKGFTSLPFDLGSFKTVAVKVIDVYGHEVVGVRKVKG